VDCKRKSYLFKLGVALMALLLPAGASAGTVILKRAFVEKYKDRATIDANFIVGHAHKRPNAPAKDGDMHVAGRSAEVGLPMVAEVMNAAQPGQKKTVALIHGVEGKPTKTNISGVWRFWFEHPADSQVQFAPVPAPKNTNPDHSFEIHPVTQFGTEKIPNSLDNIPKFSAHEAKKAFGSYEKLQVTLASNGDSITLQSPKSGFNYVEFNIRLLGKPKALKDGGLQVQADVEDGSEDALAQKVRMIFVAGSPAAKTLKDKNLGDGDDLHVLGIPRVNLNAVFTLAKTLGTKQVKRKLPYEMIIVAILKD
jgi:hypothetical protein